MSEQNINEEIQDQNINPEVQNEETAATEEVVEQKSEVEVLKEELQKAQNAKKKNLKMNFNLHRRMSNVHFSHLRVIN
jgi:hypothetical protein